MDPHTEKCKSWYDITVEEEEEEARILAVGPDTILAAKFSRAVSFSSPVGTQPARSEFNPHVDPLSEALNLEWTAEDAAAYFDDDDLLGDEIEESLQVCPVSTTQEDSGQTTFPATTSTPPVAALKIQATGSKKESVSVDPPIAGPLGKKEPTKRKSEARQRRALDNPGLLVNMASRKIQNLKGRSPSKRLANKAGSSKLGSSRRAASVPWGRVLPSSKTKTSSAPGVLVGSPIPPATNP